MKTIPITLNNDHEKIIGFVFESDAGMTVKFNEGANVTKKEFFDIFNCGCNIKKIEEIPNVDIDFENFVINEAEILAFNLTRTS
mgnify:CR=1 FL=1